LQASQSASIDKFQHAIDCVRNVRDAWHQVARDPAAHPGSGRMFAMSQTLPGDDFGGADGEFSKWNA
jgi:hypothetical protein